MDQNDLRYIVKAKEGQPLLYQLNQPIYMRKQFAVTASQTVNFFKDIPANATKLDTNMTQGGSLPKPYEMDVWGISLFIAPTIAWEDWAKLQEYTYFRFLVNDDAKIEGPLHMIPSQTGPEGSIVTTETNKKYGGFFMGSRYETGYMPVNVGRSPIFIPEQTSFYVEVKVEALAVFTATFYATMYLHGVYRKNK